MGDYCNSLTGYWDLIRQFNLPFAEMLKLSGDGPSLFTEWSITHLLLYVIVAVIWSILVIVNGAPVVDVMIGLLLGLVIAYLLSHLGWFIIVVNNGCCHPIVSALLGIIFIFWGIHYVAYGIRGKGAFDSPHLYTHDGEVSSVIYLIRIVLFVLYGISLIYMGISAIICCNQGGGSDGFRGADDLEVAGDASGPVKRGPPGTRRQAASPPVARQEPCNPPSTSAKGGGGEQHIHVHIHTHGDGTLDERRLGKSIESAMAQVSFPKGAAVNGKSKPEEMPEGASLA